MSAGEGSVKSPAILIISPTTLLLFLNQSLRESRHVG